MKNAIHAIVECRLTSKDFMKYQFPRREQQQRRRRQRER